MSVSYTVMSVKEVIYFHLNKKDKQQQYIQFPFVFCTIFPKID